MTARPRWAAAFLGLAACALPAWADADKVVRADRYGDPLPDGAAARMGTVRFRHTGEVEFVGYLPDGKTIVSVGKDDAVRWWDAASGRQLRRWAGPAALGGASLSADHTVLAARVGDDVRTWDARSGKQMQCLARPDARLAAASLSPGGRRIATCGERLRLWDAETGALLCDFDNPIQGFADVAFCPDGKTLVSTGRDGMLRWWDIPSGKVVHEVQAHNGEGWLVAVSPDGDRLATWGAHGMVRLWDGTARSEVRALPASGASDQAGCLAFSPDGKVLAVGCGGGAIHLFDASNGDELRRCEGHEGAVSAIAFSVDGATLVSGGADAAVRQWDAASGKEIRPFAGPWGQVGALAISPDGARVASAGIDRRVHLWDAASGEERRSLEGPDGGRVEWLGFSADGSALTAAWRGARAGACVWATADGKAIHSFLLSDKGYIVLFALSPGGATLAAARPDKIALFDAVTGEILHECDEESGPGVFQAGPFLGGKTMTAFRHANGPYSRIDGLWVWDMDTDVRTLRSFRGELGGVESCAASPDGNVLAAAGADGMVQLWNVSTGECIRSLRAGKDFILATAFSADGRTFATADIDGSVSVWETATGLRRARLRADQGFIDALAFSPHGRRLYSGGHDGTVLAWDLTGRQGQTGAPGADLDERALERLWNDLAEADGPGAYEATWALAAAPEKSVPFLQARLRREPPTPERVAQWITDLDNDDFATRERASRELRGADEAAEAALTAALAGRPSPEARRRVEELLDWVKKARRERHPPEPQVVRAVEALEAAGTPAACELLTGLTEGPETSLTREAKATLERLRRRAPAAP